MRFAAGACGDRYQGRDDLFLAVADPGVSVAGVFTQSQTPSAPVVWCRRQLGGGPRGVIVNAGSANAFTGECGEKIVRATAQAVGAAVDCAAEAILVASTGVIGEPPAADKITQAVPGLADALCANPSPAHWQTYAAAIATTDTYPKAASANAKIGGVAVTINGIAKGSGMIEPNMATLLVFVFTDAALPQPLLQQLLVEANADTFNAISVDGDTSTSDTCLLFATGGAGNRPGSKLDSKLDDFRRALKTVCADLAAQVVRDGEGAQKCVRVEVVAAQTAEHAERVARRIANSNLVKTAIAGGDANWGRIVMAVGDAAVPIVPEKLRVSLGGVVVAENGQRAEFDSAQVDAHLGGSEIQIQVALGAGEAEARVLTCDLTHGYIQINAHYRS